MTELERTRPEWVAWLRQVDRDVSEWGAYFERSGKRHAELLAADILRTVGRALRAETKLEGHND